MDATTPTDTAQNKPSKRKTPPQEKLMEKPPTIDLRDPSLYINRELSNIEFNRRVLHETQSDHPLLERAKFLAIFHSNMDEFFMVRVSGLKQQLLSLIHIC